MAPSWRNAVAVALTLLGFAALCQGTSDFKCYSFLHSGKGTIQPQGDIIIEVGSSYEAYCLFNPAEVNVDDMYFKTSGSDERIPHKVVNNSAIRIEVPANEAASYNLKCLEGNDTFVCQRSVFAGYKPQDVQNFTCLSRNWQNLNCSWSVPENPVTVAYSLMYVIQDYIFEPRECPLTNEKKTWCYWEGAHFSSGRRNWSMKILAKNSLTEVEFIHDVDLFASVIPNMASNYVVNVLGPRQVILRWNLAHPMDVFKDGNVTQEVKYRIKPFRDVFQHSSWTLVDRWEESPQRFTRKVYNRTISDLYPYVEYEFSVRLHTGTGPIREEMWSKPALVTKRTEATLPTVAPLTTLGMFEVEETKLHREVHVSWQTVNPWEENGPGFTYEVRMFGTDAERNVSSNTTDDSYLKFCCLENNITYRFEIRPMNHEGFPEPDVKSEVIVPEKADLLSVPDYLKVIAYPANDTTTYMVRWRLPGLYRASHIIETITLYWCKQTDYENRCQNKIAWEIIDKPDAHVKNLTGYDPSSRYMFGISVNSNNSSSGIKWSGCIATHGEQQPALKNFNCTYVSATEVKLKWSLDCKAEAAQPSGFNISYCIAEENANKCSGPEMYEGVEGESSVRHTVRNLHPYKHYIFNIASISDLGFGKWTPSIRLQTKPSKPSGPPQHINVVSKGPSWIALVWRPPLESEQNGQIILYDIKWKIKDSQSFSNIQRNTSYTPNILQYNFTHLDPFTEYHFEVVPCTRVNQESACGTIAADIDVKTKIGAPGKIDSLEYDSPWLKWDHEECNGPSCFYEVHYTVNDTTSTYNTPINHTAILLRDMNISCPANGDIPVRLRAVNTDEEGHHIYGPAREMKITCHSKGLAVWIILTIVVICIIVTLVFVTIFTYGREEVKEFIKRLYLEPALPTGLDPKLQSQNDGLGGKKKWYERMSSGESIKTDTSPFKPSEKQDLIKPGLDRKHRNLSGDSGTSIADPADSSGCSTGGDSVSSSGSDRIPQSSDSGTVQEETGFGSEEKKLGSSVRQRTTAPPYVCQALANKVPKGYVSVGSVPNLAVSSSDGILPLQHSNPSLGLETLPEVPMGGRRTSTGYISMPTNENDGMSFPLDDLGNLILPHERRPGEFLAYSRHYMPYKKTSDFSSYSKAQSLPWLNTGYVAVAQAEDRGQSVPGAQGYVAVGDAMNAMKRQPSLPLLPISINKTITTPDEELPNGAYCKLGALGSSGPPPNSTGYVSEHHMPNARAISPPVFKSPYVTCAMAESMVSPKKDPRRTTTDYVSVGDMNDGLWAHPIIHPMTPEDSREVLSAPVEGSRGRVIQPVRPNSSEISHNRGSSQFAPPGHSLSKQSSGYASGNVSQETLTFNDPLVMSPKKLLARSHEPHSVVYSPNHKPSMV